MRKRIYEIIDTNNASNTLNKVYNSLMLIFIILSLIPLAFKENTSIFILIDKICVGVFVVDYFLRLITADFYYNEKSYISFVRYPFSFFAIIDLITILSALTIFNSIFRLLRLMRAIRILRVFRVLRLSRYSKSIHIIADVFNSSKEQLITTCTLALAYIFISALIIFNVEPSSFKSFFEAIYWSTMSLTTVGYGDIYPVTVIGRLIAMISSIFGIAIIALPAGIITAGYMNELNKNDKNN